MKTSRKFFSIMLVLALALVVFASSANAAVFSIITRTLSNGTVGQPYSATLTANISGVRWSVAAGALPPGLDINESAGTISGSPTEAGTFSFVISAANNDYADAASFQVVIENYVPPVQILTESLRNGTTNNPYVDVLVANVSNVSWGRTGNLPDGLELDGRTGIISGTPTRTGTSEFTVSATDGNTTDTKRLSITIAADPIEILTGLLPDGTVGQEYTAEVIANKSGTWSATGLPGGLSIEASTGKITGTPSAAGTSSVTVRVTDGTTSDTRTYHLTIEEQKTQVIYVPNVTPVEEFRITTPSRLPDGSVNTEYSLFRFEANTTSQVSWRVSAAALPSGLTLSDTGNLTGTPGAAGTFVFEVTATIASSNATARETFQLVINPGGTSNTLEINSGRELYATVGQSTRITFTANIAGARWSVTPSLPAGLTLNSETGVVTGTPRIADTYSLNVTANANGQTAVAEVTLIIEEAGSNNNNPTNVTITPTSITVPRGEAMREVTLVAGNLTVTNWSVPNLPSGTTCNPTTGVISGTPTTAGDYILTVTLTTLDGTERTGRVTMRVTGTNESDDDSSGCNAATSIYALSLVAGLFGLKRKH